MLNLSKENLYIIEFRYLDMITVAMLSIGVTILLSKAWTKIKTRKGGIPGRLGLPLLGETFAFLSATNSTTGCYEFVRLRRQW